MSSLLLVLTLIAVILIASTARASSATYHTEDHKARYVRVTRDAPILEVAEIQAYDMANMNRAPLSTVSQSSVKQNNRAHYGPDIVINGNISGYAIGELATTKATDKSPWVEVDLGAPIALSRVTVFLRDKGSFPSPNSTWYKKSDSDACVQLLSANREVIWRRPIYHWKWIYDYPLTTIF